MTTSEKLCLKWNDFTPNIRSSFSDLRTDDDLSDVTLACEDGILIEANKIILSAGSQFFRNIFKWKKGAIPIVFMKGIKNNHLTAIVDFLYYGEVNVPQDDINDFLKIAQELKLKGLQINEEQISTKTVYDRNLKPEQSKYDTASILNIEEIKHEFDIPSPLEEEPTEQSIKVTKTDGLAQKMLDLIQRSGDGWHCTVCGKEAKRKDNLIRHTQIHLEGLCYPCNLCGREFSSKTKIDYHVYRSHKSV